MTADTCSLLTFVHSKSLPDHGVGEQDPLI